ncbi:glycosyltransferase [Modestobacter sp. VKM Ac-2977]|uniref:glycosyltransferase n=1 Tax=Modestobacter sp. VKM Ac-2977 TaxID=3004131 RepID=UPI0022AA3F01|nr:glycosyltransferase [Modestobacter sp. VKM Ac-2977]MCZ2822353.1 glycosyltransferase [Modestobacter sp. VKM Ac-2977]
MLDDYFPTTGTGFRIAEFDWMMRHGIVSEVMTTATPLDHLRAEYSATHPNTAEQISAYDAERLSSFECASLLFLNNAAYFLPDLEKHSLPFVLTLYPGGGLNFGDSAAEEKLSRVLSSPLLSHVITTQPVVTERATAMVRDSVPVTEVLGLTVDPLYLTPGPGFRKNYFRGHGERLDVCFVAHRYTSDGADKGFPVFLETVRLLREGGQPVRGHVVGGYSSADVGPEYAAVDLTFTGVISTPELRQFFLGMDVIVSPTAPNRLAPGSFDGFPTGACVEAALCGVAVVASDPLAQNRVFTDRRDIHTPAADAHDIVERISEMLAEPDGLRRVAQGGLKTARRAYGVNAQLWTRRRVLEEVRSSIRSAALTGEPGQEPEE